MIPEGYNFKQTLRIAKNRGGGIGVIYEKHIQIKKESQPNHILHGNYGDNT